MGEKANLEPSTAALPTVTSSATVTARAGDLGGVGASKLADATADKAAEAAVAGATAAMFGRSSKDEPENEPAEGDAEPRD